MKKILSILAITAMASTACLAGTIIICPKQITCDGGNGGTSKTCHTNNSNWVINPTNSTPDAPKGIYNFVQASASSIVPQGNCTYKLGTIKVGAVTPANLIVEAVKDPNWTWDQAKITATCILGVSVCPFSLK